MPSSERNSWLDICRALAICLVLMSHGRHLLLPALPSLQVMNFGGFLGVEIFFVLSGLLIGKILIEEASAGTESPWVLRFWLRRWLRTLPAYYSVLAVNIHLVNREVSAAEAWRYITFTQTFFDAKLSFFLESWSLAVEELFYLMCPLAIVMLRRFFRRPADSVLAAALMIGLPSLFVRVLYVLRDAPVNVRCTSSLRLDAFAFGIAAAWVMTARPEFTARMQYWSRRGLILLPCVACWAALSPEPQSLAFKLVSFTAASVASLALIVSNFSLAEHPKTCRVANAIANWSYAAYLSNLLVLQWLFSHPLASNTYLAGCLINYLAFWVMTMALSALAYKTFERPILRWRNKLLPESRRRLDGVQGRGVIAAMQQ